MNGEGSIELNSWFVSRSFRLMVCGCARSVVAVLENEKRIRNSLLSRAAQLKRAWPTMKLASAGKSILSGLISVIVAPPCLQDNPHLSIMQC